MRLPLGGAFAVGAVRLPLGGAFAVGGWCVCRWAVRLPLDQILIACGRVHNLITALSAMFEQVCSEKQNEHKPQKQTKNAYSLGLTTLNLGLTWVGKSWHQF